MVRRQRPTELHGLRLASLGVTDMISPTNAASRRFFKVLQVSAGGVHF